MRWAGPAGAVLTIALLAVSVAVDPPAGADETTFTVIAALIALAFAVVGAVIVARLPRQRVGRLFVVLGPAWAFVLAGDAYATWALGGERPGGTLVAWVVHVVSGPTLLGGPMILLLVFPDGRLGSARWRPLAIATVSALLAWTVAEALAPGRLGDFDTPNPLGLSGALGDVADAVKTASEAFGPVIFLLCAAAMVTRLRSARGVERQQLKWFSFAAALVGIGFAGSVVVPTGTAADLLFFAGLLAGAGLPVTAGVAILRHRLYDIDVVINRALVYSALSATLAGAYLATVLLLGLVVGGGSSLTIAASTLAVAALFGPARVRIQAGVDHRFYRRRYDAARTLESFGARLRDEVDLDALGADLRGVVTETLSPAHVSLWLREASR